MIRNKSFAVLLFAVLMLICAGCTRNDGNIGDLFGRWKIVMLSADGEELPLYDGDVEMYAWWFQGELVWIHELKPYHEYVNYKGMWSRDGDRLSLDFSFTGDYDEQYRPPKALHLVEDGVTTLTVASEASSEIVLWYIADNGIRYEYRLKKIY